MCRYKHANCRTNGNGNNKGTKKKAHFIKYLKTKLPVSTLGYVNQTLFKKYFIRTSNLHICIVLVNIRNKYLYLCVIIY